MSYYNLEQTLKVFQTSLPEILLPFDLPQLADLCKRGEITPVFPYDKYINEGLGNDHELPTYLKELKKPFNGYLTFSKLIDLILQPTKAVTTSTAYVYEEIGTVNKGAFVSLEDYGYDRYEDYSNGHNSYCSGDINCISVNNLLFPIEQMQAYISSKHTKELNEPIPPATTGTFGNPTVAHGEPETIEQFREALAAANAKVRELDSQLKQAIATLADKPANSVTHSNTDMQNVKKAAIRQFNRSLATVLIELDYKEKLRKGDIANYIVPHMKQLAFALADEDMSKANNLTVTYSTLYDTHLQDLNFKQGRQSNADKNKINIDLLFKKQLPVTE